MTMMTRSAAGRLFVFLLLAVATSGCGIIAGIFKAGVWVGIIVAALIVVGVVLIIGKTKK